MMHLEKMKHGSTVKKRNPTPSKLVLPSSAHIFINDQIPADESNRALLGKVSTTFQISCSFYQNQT